MRPSPWVLVPSLGDHSFYLRGESSLPWASGSFVISLDGVPVGQAIVEDDHRPHTHAVVRCSGCGMSHREDLPLAVTLDHPGLGEQLAARAVWWADSRTCEQERLRRLALEVMES